MLPFGRSATYEIPARGEGQPVPTIDDDSDGLFGELPNEETTTSQTPPTLPKTHVLYSIEMAVQCRSAFNRHRWKTWNLATSSSRRTRRGSAEQNFGLASGSPSTSSSGSSRATSKIS